ncbi:MAG: Rrf2 family transcriptional regulator [Calditrichia bacterium]
MKITAQEEYGLRILLRIAFSDSPEGISIPQISKLEGISQHYVGKLCRLLRLAGFINSSRGKEGGYTLARSPGDIRLKAVLESLGGRLYTPEFCGSHTGNLKACTHTVDCSVRSVWMLVQQSVDTILQQMTLQHLLPGSGEELPLSEFIFEMNDQSR